MIREPKYIYGNFEWENGIPDTRVIFKPSENQQDFSWTGRWSVSKNPTPGGSGNTCRVKFIKGQESFLPPMESEHVLGVDPYDFKRVVETSKASMGAGVIGKCFDFYGKEDVNDICAVYNWRPKDPAVFYEDMLMGAVFYGAWVNSESRNIKIFDHFEERGYYEYMLPKNPLKPKQELKGSATTAPLIQEMCTLIEAFSATSLNQIWHEIVFEELLDFDPENTQKSNIVMALGHMLLGFAKRRRFYKKTRKRNNEEINGKLAAALADNYFG